MVEQKRLDRLLDACVLYPCLRCLCIHPLQDRAMLRVEHFAKMDVLSALLTR
jgi:hypothetical protein